LSTILTTYYLEGNSFFRNFAPNFKTIIAMTKKFFLLVIVILLGGMTARC
jgi:hypothetical protein